VKDSPLPPAEFLQNYITASNPLILRQVLKGWSAFDKEHGWTRERLVEALGTIDVETGTVCVFDRTLHLRMPSGPMPARLKGAFLVTNAIPLGHPFASYRFTR
jgi:hypothetical protein